MALTKINTNLIANNTIALTNIADNAIDATKIANNQILARHIAAGSISDQLAAAQPTITSLGTLTTLTVDNITIDGTTITGSGSNDITIDGGGRIDLSADDNGEIRLYDGSSLYAQFKDDDDRLSIQGLLADKDILFVVNDGGSATTAMKLDAADAGTATFYHDLLLTSSGKVGLGITPAEILDIKSSSGDARIRLDAPASSDTEIKFYNAGAAQYTIGHDDATDNFVIGGANVDAPLVSVTKAGRVGINWAAPNAMIGMLHSGSSTAAMNLSDGSTSDFLVYPAFASGRTRIGTSAGSLEVIVAGSERMRINTSGKVGIGTAAPGNALTVAEATNYNPPGLGNDGGHFGIFKVDAGSPAYGLIMGVQGTGTSWIQNQRIDSTATSYPLVLQPSGGNVGIGNASPATTLHLDASGGAVFRMQRTSVNSSNKFEVSVDGSNSTITSIGGILNITNDDIRFKTSGDETMLRALANSSVELMYDNSTKLATASGGVTVTGTLTASGAATVTSITAASGFLGGSNGGLRIHSGGTKFFNITAANAPRDAVMDIGASDARFKELFLSGSITAGSAGNSSANLPALKVTATNTTDTGAAIAIQQAHTEGDTILFADYEPHVEWGISCDNSVDEIHFTAGSSTNSLGSKTFYNNAGSARTAYIKHKFTLGNGNASFGGLVGIGTASPSKALHVVGSSGIRNERAGAGTYDMSIDNTVTGDAADLNFIAQTNDTGYHFRVRKADASLVSALTMNSDGKVGIGTTSPSDVLNVYGSMDVTNSGIYKQEGQSFGTRTVNSYSAASTGVNATVESNENRAGVYWLNFNSTKFRAFIKPDWLQGRNWILAAKFFHFADMPSGSSLWTNDTTVNDGDFDIYSGNFSKYLAWRYFSFNRLAMQMGNRIAPIMQFSSSQTLYGAFSGGRASNGGGVTANTTDPQIGNSATYHGMEAYAGANFTNMSGSEDIMQSYGLNKWANNSTNSTSANNNGSADMNSDVSQGFQLTVEDAHRHTAGVDANGVAGAWIGCPLDEGAYTFGGASSNGGADSGFGMGIGCGNTARTTTSGIAEWALGNRVANYLPAYIWLSID